MKLNLRSREAAIAAALTNTRGAGSDERLIGNNGDINAGSNKELLSRIIEIAGLVSSGKLDDAMLDAGGEQEVSSAERQEIFLEAYNDRHGSSFAELGSGIAADIHNSVSRRGFMRRFLLRGNTANAAIVRHRVKHRNVTAVMANGPTAFQLQRVRDTFLMPKEFHIGARPYVAELELHQGGTDTLQDKADEGLEAIMVQEDLSFVRAARTASNVANTPITFSGTVTPNHFALLQHEVQSWSLPAVAILMAMDLLPDINSSSTWNANFLNPVSQLEVLLTGRLGSIYGMDIVTDGFRNDRLRVVNNGELFCFTSQDTLGAYTDRGPVQSAPIGIEVTGVPGRGWQMHETVSVTVGNARGVARATRA